MSSQYEEVLIRDDEGNVVDSYVERIVDSNPYAGEDPPDDYYDERADGPSDNPWQEHECTDCAPGGGYSDEPPF